jgi:hypothetical protein
VVWWYTPEQTPKRTRKGQKWILLLMLKILLFEFFFLENI